MQKFNALSIAVGSFRSDGNMSYVTLCPSLCPLLGGCLGRSGRLGQKGPRWADFGLLLARAGGRAGERGERKRWRRGAKKGQGKRRERFRDPINVPFRSESDRIFFSSASWQEKRKPTAKYPPLFSTGDSFLLYGGRERAGAVVEVASGRSFVTFA